MIIFENGATQLFRHESGDLIVLVKGVDWYYPKSVQEGIEKMLKRDWDLTLVALARLVEW